MVRGKGFVSLMGIKKVPVKWTNIFIDSDSRHQQGVINAETDGLNNMLHQWDVNVAEQNATYVDGNIDTVFISGNQVCYTLQQSTIPICVPTPTGTNVMVIRDGEGNQYNVDFIPPPPKITGPVNFLHYSTDSLAADENTMVTFEMSVSQQYGFDDKQYAAFIKNYEVIKLKNGKNYFVPNKSVGEGKTDEVLASVQVTGFNSSLLKFKTFDGNNLNFTAEGNNKFKITGISHNVNSVYAVYNNKIIGKLNIISLKQLNKKVVLVPVNNSNISLTNGQLNNIFKQANVSWTVSSASNFSFGLGSDGLDAADATLLSKYSAEMRALRDAYKQHDSLYDKEAYYLFVVPGFNNTDVKGYMVRGRAVGFVSAAASVKEIAHELAHGAFALEHTFPEIEKSSSGNLMDYSSGTRLVKKQWFKILLGINSYNWFDEEEDASYIGKYNTAAGAYYWINKIKVAYKNNTQLIIPGQTDLIGRADKCYLAGIQYDSIAVYVKNQFYDYNSDVKNKIVITVVPRITPKGVILDSCILIDGGKIIVRTAYRRLNNMKIYLETTSTFKNLILFVNGYRPILNRNGDPVETLLEYQDSYNNIEFGDSRNYWKGIDAQFMNRIQTRAAVYADGHHTVGTSNHNSTAKYSAANLVSKQAKGSCILFGDGPMCHVNEYLHTTPNIGGFLKRQNNGDEAGKDFIRKINSGELLFDVNTDTLDIVAHSMGYAYAVGMINRLKSVGVKFGRCYILAPENAGSGSTDWGIFREVWQYGTDEIQ
ncbi:MAG: hypothetical protein JWO32_745 [Bacteroidetes bacterium]|nr:hypothetical protein [Bacteroidota bacterium]